MADLRSVKMELNPKGVLGGARRRMSRQSKKAKALGLKDPYKRKKKKKILPEASGLRKSFHSIVTGGSSKYRKLMDALK